MAFFAGELRSNWLLQLFLSEPMPARVRQSKYHTPVRLTQNSGLSRILQVWVFDLIHLKPRVGPEHPSSPFVHLLPHLFPFLLFPFIPWLYLFSSFVHPFSFYQNSPTPFPGQRSQEATEPGFSLFFLCVICVICIPQLRWIVVFCSIWFSFVCSFSALTLLVGSFDP